MSCEIEKKASNLEKLPFALCGASAVLALIPIGRAVQFMLCAGVDVPSNDDVIFFNLIERMGQSNYNWQNYFLDTFINGHSFAVGLALFWLNAVLTRANQTVMLVGALLLLCGRFLLMNDYLFGNFSRRIKIIMLPVLSMLLFAPSQTAILAHGTFALTWQLSLFANILSLWTIAKWKDSKVAKTCSSISAIVGCWTGATSLPLLPLLFLQNYLNGARQLREFFWVAAAAILAMAPYLASFAGSHGNSRSITEQLVGNNITTFLNVLGRPFANGIGYSYAPIPQAQSAGLLGLAALSVLIFLAWKHTELKANQSFFFPSAICTAMGFISAALVAAVRPFIAPTNCSLSSLFWCGLTAMSIYCFCFAGKYKVLTKAVALLVLSTIIVSTVIASRKFEDKQYYLDNRAPYSASMLRHYPQAPTYATRMLFKLVNLPPYALAMPLERHGWSIFAPHREYTLQGDFALPSVVLKREKRASIYWVEGDNATETASWKSYLHRNLALKANCDVDWQVKIPEKCKTALLHCKLLRACSPDESIEKLIKVRLPNSSLDSINDLKTPHGINLAKFAGQSITISFQHKNPGVCIIQYPTIELIAPCDPPQSGSAFEPANILTRAPLAVPPQNYLVKVDDQRLSIRPPRPMTVQEFQSLNFLTTGKPGLVNCVVKYKIGKSAAFEIPLFGPSKPAVYSQPGRIFDDCPYQIEEISLVNNSGGVLADYVVSGYLNYQDSN